MDKDGSFIRKPSAFVKNEIVEGGRFAPEAGRYHLYIALACPWACGTLTALHFKGLAKAIGVSVVHPTWARTRPDDPADTHCGWHFRKPGDAPVANSLGHGANECDDACVPDDVNGFGTIRDLYEKADDTSGKYSTPVLWCKKEQTIVSNESMEILRMFDSSFDTFCEHPENKLFPDSTQKKAEALNEFIYSTINNGVYRCGFAQKQPAYQKAMNELFSSLDRLEKDFGSSAHKFLTGDSFTWIDLRLYHTLVRFDPVYNVYFKTNRKKIADYPNLLNYVRECYSVEAVKKTTNIKHIKMHYYTSHPTLNTYGIIPESNGMSLEKP
jgi:putative glutathione S-transferase